MRINNLKLIASVQLKFWRSYIQILIRYKDQKYFLIFVGDYSKCARIYVLRPSNETAVCFKAYVNFVENQFKKKVKRLQCDKGTEDLNLKICSREGRVTPLPDRCSRIERCGEML